ncbi:type IV toxin-antitoxin system AbiEi family antitoxin domain-containing protein [Microbacterium sp. NPDC055357]
MDPQQHTYAELRASGMSRRGIDRAVRAGDLIRVRKGRYLESHAASDVVRAARLGGKPDCISLLADLGVFVLERPALHIVVPVGSSRLGAVPKGVVRHWRSLDDDVVANPVVVGALAQACRCQPIPAAIATLDSAWHLGLVEEAEIADVLSLLPARYRAIRPFLDPLAESGPETLVRLMLRRLGSSCVAQVEIHRVGRVDLLVDGWLIVECDSKAFHSSWKQQRDDRRRDFAAAQAGFVTLRLLAEDILYRPDEVMSALRGALSGRPTVHNSSRKSGSAASGASRHFL